MTEAESPATRALDRRTLLRGGLVAGGVGSAAIAASLVGAPPAAASSTTSATVPPPTGDPAVDTVALQTAVAVHKLVRLPAGTYVIDDTIRLPSGVTIQGEGTGVTTIRLANGVPGGTHMIEASSTPTDPARNIGLRDLTLDGNKANNTAHSQIVLLSYVRSCVFDSVEIKDSPRSGLVLFQDCADVWFTSCRAVGNTYTGYLVQDTFASTSHENVTMTGCLAYDNGLHGFDVVDSFNVTYNGCIALNNGANVDDFGGAKQAAGFSSDSGVRVTYNGCIAFENPMHGFQTWGGAAGAATATKSVTYNGCLSKDNGERGFQLTHPDLVTLTGCEAAGNREGIVALATVIAGKHSYLTVAGCQVHDNGESGIRLAGVSHAIVANNLVWSNGKTATASLRHGIRLEPGFLGASSFATEYVSITGNQIFDTASPATQDFAISASGTSHLAVLDNVHYGNLNGISAALGTGSVSDRNIAW